MVSAKKLQEYYKQGKNLNKFLREEKNIDYNSKEIIEISYDLQSGAYIRAVENNNEIKNHKIIYTKMIADEILSLCDAKTILEAGVGEATTFTGVLSNLPKDIKGYGFDISWSRIAYAKKWLNSNHISNYELCTGDLFNMPYLDNSIDVVYTSHSIEPNGGKEKEIIEELYRVSKKYLILLEPGYELTSDENRERMDEHKYCKGIYSTCVDLGYKVLKHELIKSHARDSNPTAITIIEKNINLVNGLDSVYACPKHKVPLKKTDDGFFSEEALCIYPILNMIPCLRIENSILSTKYEEFL